MQGKQSRKPLRTRVYIDGYNLYYGCLKNSPYKWLDIYCLFERHILPSVLLRDEAGVPKEFALLKVGAIKFFTAKIIESVAKSPDSVSSQARYHTALRKLYSDQVEILEGYYAVNKVAVKLVDRAQPNRQPKECEEALAWKVEEKQSDVNLALQAYHDAIKGNIDHAIIVTNDTDITPALAMIREHTDVLIGVVTPTRNQERRPNKALTEHSHWTRTHITQSELSDSQLPRVIKAGRKPTTKPISWFSQPKLLQQVLDLAIPIRGNQSEAFKWMSQPNKYLNNRRPIDLVETEGGAYEVLAYIHKWKENNIEEEST